jgi:hypothetical protein
MECSGRNDPSLQLEGASNRKHDGDAHARSHARTAGSGRGIWEGNEATDREELRCEPRFDEACAEILDAPR